MDLSEAVRTGHGNVNIKVGIAGAHRGAQGRTQFFGQKGRKNRLRENAFAAFFRHILPKIP